MLNSMQYTYGSWLERPSISKWRPLNVAERETQIALQTVEIWSVADLPTLRTLRAVGGLDTSLGRSPYEVDANAIRKMEANRHTLSLSLMLLTTAVCVDTNAPELLHFTGFYRTRGN